MRNIAERSSGEVLLHIVNARCAAASARSRSSFVACGSCAMMPVKMINEMPLPTPRAVICSPSHIRNSVPPTIVITVVSRKYQPGSITALPLGPLIVSRPIARP